MFIDQEGIDESKFGNARGNLSNLFLGMRACVVGINLQRFEGPVLGRNLGSHDFSRSLWIAPVARHQEQLEKKSGSTY
jgi:hypothetical protein